MTSPNTSEKIVDLENRIGAELGPRGGKIIGKTTTGKPIYDTPNHPAHQNFNMHEHMEASNLHDHEANRLQSRPESQNFEVRKQIKQHRDNAGQHSGMAFQHPQSRAAAVAVARLEKRVAVDFQEYKKEHPGTQKAPTDQMFSPQMGQAKPHLPHDQMMKLPLKEHYRLSSEHRNHALDAEEKGDHVAADKHHKAADMHDMYSVSQETPKPQNGIMFSKGELQRARERKKSAPIGAQRLHDYLSKTATMKNLDDKISALKNRLAGSEINHNKVIHKTPSGKPVYNHFNHPKHTNTGADHHQAGFDGHAYHAAAAHLSGNEQLRDHHVAHAAAHHAALGHPPTPAHKILEHGHNLLNKSKH